MNARWILGLVSVLGTAACAADSGSQEEPIEQNEVDQLGSLSLALTGTDTSGRTYRLRNAQFEIYGYSDTDYPMSGDGGSYGGFYKVVSTETDPDALSITERVVPGAYDIYLSSSDWYLERFVNGGWERVEQAVLLTGRSQYTYVYHGGVSRVAYRFGVDGELIDFRAGDLEIGIEIEQPGEAPQPPCFPFPGFPFPVCPDGGIPGFPGDAGMPGFPQDAGAIDPEPSQDAGAIDPEPSEDAGVAG